jgi:site-specific DNA recombinase
MASAIRVIIQNPMYTGQQRWNTSRFVRDPDTGKHLRLARPKSEHVVHQIERLRIVTDDVWNAAQARTRSQSDTDGRLKSGGRAKYLLSGLLKCEKCGSHYVMGDAHKYVCSGFLNGRACSNDIRVRRDALEDKIIGPVRKQQRDPVLVAEMGREIEQGYAAHLQVAQARAGAAPRELQAIDARLDRLRARQAVGDPDMAADELAAGARPPKPSGQNSWPPSR